MGQQRNDYPLSSGNGGHASKNDWPGLCSWLAMNLLLQDLDPFQTAVESQILSIQEALTRITGTLTLHPEPLSRRQCAHCMSLWHQPRAPAQLDTGGDPRGGSRDTKFLGIGSPRHGSPARKCDFLSIRQSYRPAGRSCRGLTCHRGPSVEGRGRSWGGLGCRRRFL